MGGATRLMMLLTTPFPLYPRHHSLLRLAALRLSSSLTPAKSSISRRHQSQTTTATSGGVGGGGFSIKASSGHIHTHTNSLSSSYDGSGSNSWPEWVKLVDGLAAAGYFGRRASPEVDGFVETEGLADGFLDSGSAILAFARNRPELLRALSRKDIEVVVQCGSPFLFKDTLDSTRRMRLFLDANGSNAVEYDRAHTIDLVKYLLSFASNPALASKRDNVYNREFVESSVRNLLSELAALSCSVLDSTISAPLQRRFPDRHEQTPRPPTQNIEMKRGDWICPKCSFMNFARNAKCLECEEARPKRQLTGGEWECPQCDFFNYGRNSVCMRCDCKRPGESSFVTTSSSNINYANKAEIDSRLAANEEKAERWFNKVSQLESSDDLSSAAADEDFPEIMPLRKGVNRFVVSTRKTPLERRLANAQYRQNDAPESNGSQTDTKLGRSLDEILGRTSARETSETKTPVSASSGENLLLSEKPVNQSENKEKEIEEAEKSERWFKRVAELHDVTDLASAISDDDFPEIMPMRKGENRFVVSKKKDRSLTSPMYKRRAAMEQASSTNFVPFVPFPPDYFAKKDKPQPEGQAQPEHKPQPEDKLQLEGQVQPEVMPQPEAEDKTAQTESPNAPDEPIDAKTLVPDREQQKPSNPPESSWSQQIENTNVRERWAGKSLEGSAVKAEPDPLDMSEEAKAERWFRRVAQIKDISELSQIPDEDFPSIMPMRKGVNRFVVSKRKTPLERRLTSPQYRRNLPIMNSDPAKNENDSS